MSWILGFTGTSLSPLLRERLVALSGDPLHRWENETQYVAAGGLPETCHTAALPDGRWLVVGLGLERHDDHTTFLSADGWRAQMAQPVPDFDSLDGHFVALRWQPGRLEAFTDALGVRTLYVAQRPDGLAFSTRLDWLAALQGGAAINMAAFGAHWLTFNQLSTTALAEGIQRLGPGGRLTWTPERLTMDTHPWTPAIDAADRRGEGFAQRLAALVHPQPAEGQAVSLGLSGGLDSRLLLALRLGQGTVCTHVFGPDDHPDVQIAQRIAEGEGLEQHHLHAPVPDADTCLALLRDQVAQTQAVSAASSVIGLRYYPALHARRLVMIDGGLGEAARRQFMNRLLRRGRAALHAGNPAAILLYLRVPRAKVFTPKAQTLMEQGAHDQIAALWQRLPPIGRIGAENFVDLLGVQTRLPNFFGFEQNRLDALLPNYMPFAQPSLLEALFQTPLALRRNGRLFRRLIRARRASLARYPLVKGGLRYPFRLPTLPAYAWTALAKRFGQGYADPTRLRFLETLKPFALDTLHSESVRTYAPYDHPRLVRLVEDFYAGHTALAAPVDWWLAFEVWRRVLGG